MAIVARRHGAFARIRNDEASGWVVVVRDGALGDPIAYFRVLRVVEEDPEHFRILVHVVFEGPYENVLRRVAGPEPDDSGCRRVVAGNRGRADILGLPGYAHLRCAGVGKGHRKKEFVAFRAIVIRDVDIWRTVVVDDLDPDETGVLGTVLFAEVDLEELVLFRCRVVDDGNLDGLSGRCPRRESDGHGVVPVVDILDGVVLTGGDDHNQGRGALPRESDGDRDGTVSFPHFVAVRHTAWLGLGFVIENRCFGVIRHDSPGNGNDVEPEGFVAFPDIVVRYRHADGLFRRSRRNGEGLHARGGIVRVGNAATACLGRSIDGLVRHVHRVL